MNNKRMCRSSALRFIGSVCLIALLNSASTGAMAIDAITAPRGAATAHAQATPASAAENTIKSYKPVELATWVPPLRAPGRVILQPTGVTFSATFVDGPRQQKVEYLQMALRMMHVSEPPKVSQAILLRYGPAENQRLVAYVDDATATRLRKEIHPGDKRQFYAFHVYNYAKGPALVVTSFGPMQ